MQCIIGAWWHQSIFERNRVHIMCIYDYTLLLLGDKLYHVYASACNHVPPSLIRVHADAAIPVRLHYASKHQYPTHISAGAESNTHTCQSREYDCPWLQQIVPNPTQ